VIAFARTFFEQGLVVASCMLAIGGASAIAAEPKQGDVKKVELGGDVTLEVLYIPPGEFLMGSTQAEKDWATGIEGGATPGTIREKYEGEAPRPMKVKDGFWMGRTEVSVGQFKRFVAETGYLTDAEKPGGKTQVYDPNWKITAKAPPHPWIPMPGKSWRDPNFPHCFGLQVAARAG